MFFVGPLFPDIDSLLSQVCFVRVALEKPKQLFRYPTKWNSLGRDDRKAFAEIKPSLISEM